MSSEWGLRPLEDNCVNEDLKAIHEDRWRGIVSALTQLRAEPLLGKPLVYQPLMGGDLSDCRSLALIDLRIVYRVLEPERVIEVVAVGHRRASAVYKLALERLGRRT